MLLVISGIVLMVVGVRVLLPVDETARQKGAERRRHRAVLAASMFGIGVFTGLLANGGGFLLVPVYLLLFGLRMRQAVGTSLLVIIVLAIPALLTHWALGHINWAHASDARAGDHTSSSSHAPLYPIVACAQAVRASAALPRRRPGTVHLP